MHGVPHTVCTDDVNQELQIAVRKKHWKNGTANNLNGSIFLCEGWVKVGSVKSKREGSHQNELKLWTLSQYEKVVLNFQAGQERI